MRFRKAAAIVTAVAMLVCAMTSYGMAAMEADHHQGVYHGHVHHPDPNDEGTGTDNNGQIVAHAHVAMLLPRVESLVWTPPARHFETQPSNYVLQAGLRRLERPPKQDVI